MDDVRKVSLDFKSQQPSSADLLFSNIASACEVMNISGDEVAELVLREFDKWPTKRRPLARSDGMKEWVPLSGIVAQGMGSLKCLAAATGMKCLPQSKIGQAQGIVLHDWHAEILAIRSFNRFLLEECHELASSVKNVSDYIRLRSPNERTEAHFQPFALKEGISFHMYCSEAPCGDASMELTMAAQQDSTPWNLPSTTTSNNLLTTESTTLHGRGFFSALVLPSTQYSSAACTRAFSDSGRLSSLKDKKWSGGYAFHPFKIITTEKEFLYSRRQHLHAGEKVIPSNIATSWTPNHSDTLIGGGIQGRKQFSIKGASRVCKRRKWRLALEIAQMASIQAPKIEKELRNKSYALVKQSGLLTGRREVKTDVRSSALSGWVRNEGGEDWGVENVEI
ncbi:tRNA-specific adenosine deaminase [Marssonina coronariae]|uniref:tRNA-specific adenosine deaminase n=1 Tax=Diplocarpon coronariae TaxID=2795749 RepID=A0A218YUC3_9HELO|nr:tRNA-specific adenosine deaminase [Marssonina coronariae]